MVRLSRAAAEAERARRERACVAAELAREVPGALVWWGEACGVWFAYVPGSERGRARLVEAATLGRLRELMIGWPGAGRARHV